MFTGGICTSANTTNLEQILNKYPDRIPVIIQKADKCNLTKLDNNKYLIPRCLKMSDVIFIIRKKIKIESKQAIFIFVQSEKDGGILVPSNNVLGDVYDEFKSSDKLLYITYTLENTFG